MRRNNKQMTINFILLSLLLIGVVYAILQANLQINGTAKIQANTWDIHFDNIQVNENSVAIGTGDSAATIDSENNCKVDFEVTLSIPGDFYEFTIDVVNAGTIDGMIGELNKTLKVNNEVVSEVPDYLDYSVTYSDGVEIEENHKITAGITESYKVKLEFKTDIEELPSTTTISTSLEPQYIQADSSATPIQHFQLVYNILKEEAIKGEYVVTYNNSHKDSFTETGSKTIYFWRSNPYSTARENEILEKINLIFGGFCWQMIRTTDTGGVKILYNGLPNDGKCNNTGNARRIATSKYNNNQNSPAYVGYMYNPNTLIVNNGNSAAASESLFGTGVNYLNGTYTLTSTSTTYDENHHYTCNNITGSCSTVRYYYYDNYYTELSDGRNIEEALEDMLSADNVNQANSTIKNVIDNWYQNNLIPYSSYLEDTIFCNDRNLVNIGGWNPSGGEINGGMTFPNNYITWDDNAYTKYKNLSCPNITDQFSINNPKAKLEYPIGLLTAPELYFLSNSIRKDENTYWLMSPNDFYIYLCHGIAFQGAWNISSINKVLDVRPVVSLKPGTKYRYGDGSKNNPYIIE